MSRIVFLHDDTELTHHGVKGMKWGVRKDRPSGVPRKTNREAKRDAREFARAKMYYGQGAGTRRKLIKATVNAKSTKDAAYKKAFDYHLDNQDMAKHASKARTERKINTAKTETAKTGRGLINIFAGDPMRAGATALAVAGAYGTLKKTGADKKIAAAGKTLYNKAIVEIKTQKIKQQFKDFKF